MITSCVKNHNGVPALFVNDNPYPACAYMTYLEEYNNYAAFADAGYKLFSVPVLFAGKWISATEGLKPFHSGIFDKKGSPDFSSIEHSVSLILDACPDALIFPRINMSMPDWWLSENPGCVDSTGRRESLLTEKWKSDTGRFLEIFLNYLKQSEYYNHIVGLQLAGGNTEEWFHFDLNSGCCENAMPGFRHFLQANYPECPYNGLPDLSVLRNSKITHGSEYLAHYLEYSNNSVAEAITYFASISKKCVNRKLAVGTFYGYSLEITSPLWGTHGLKKVLECNDIDFICSPNSYIGTRDAETEWTEMYPADSVRLHGKLCMQECDIRTHLTKLLPDAAPEYDPGRKMTANIWKGPASKEESIRLISKSFNRQLKKGNGFWWFDMWGGWYNDPDIMLLMKESRIKYARSFDNSIRKCSTDIAVIVDESAYKYMSECSLRDAVYGQRKALGEAAENYDTYDVFDFEAVKDKYRLFIFMTGQITDLSRKAVGYCIENNIPYLCNSAEKENFTADELKEAINRIQRIPIEEIKNESI